MSFKGDCEEAFKFYEQHLYAKIEAYSGTEPRTGVARIGKSQVRYNPERREKARLHGSVALVNGRARITISAQGQEQSFVILYLDVNIKRGNKWQMVAWQATRLP